MSSWEKFSRIVAEAKTAKKLDPVGHEDDDVDNDGDSDSSDSYLKKRRATVGAAIAADKKKKVEEAKQLDPVGKEDEDIDNDGDSDKTDSYLRNRRKVRSKIIQREEVEQIDEIAPLVAGGIAAAAAAPYLLKKFAKPAVDKALDNATKSNKLPLASGGNMQQLRQAKQAAGMKEGIELVDEAKVESDKEDWQKEKIRNLRKHRETGTTTPYRDRLVAHTSGRGVKKGKGVKEEYVEEGKKKDDSYLETDMKKRRENNEKAIEDMKKTKGYSDMVKSARKAMGVDEEVELQEKALSRAQQRFMGMVYAAKKGETPASPEVAKAAEGMSKKAAKDFAKTKHAGLPEKKEEVKEELSLVDKILDEAIQGTIAGGKSKAKKYKAVAKQAKLAAAVNKAMKDDSEPAPQKSEEERKTEAKKQVKRGKSDPSALTRRAAVAGAARLKAEKEKTKRQRERQQYEKERRAEKKAERQEKAKEKQEKLESSYKEKRIKAAQQQSDKEEGRKEKTKSEVKGAVVGALKTIKAPQAVSDKAKGSTGATVDSYLDSAGSVVSAVGKGVRGVIAAKMKERKEKKQEQKRQERHEKIRSEMSKEEFSNWREEFILEVDDQSVQNEKQKVIDISKKKNKIEINPNMSEECGCDEKEKETPKKDMRDLPTKVNLAKTKLRSAGVRNPVVMVTSEENIQEIAPLVGVLARVAGGAAARGITSRVAGSAAQGTLRSKAAELLGKKAGEMTAQSVQDKLTPKFKDEPETDSEPYMTNLEKKLRNEDWQSVNRKDKTDGLSQKAVNAYRRENPGSKLQTAVTEKNPEGKRAARRKSFCSRMSGMKKRLTSAETARDPDSRINKALRRWNCN